ncbi:MAG: hypothetical protein SV422_03360 [Pseudomonadota bacterium]|nr:hypothetical protein [Pseudomonadota bacterium]
MRTVPRILLSLLVAASMDATAQPQPADAIEATESPGTPRALRAEIRTLERDMFELFNKLNSDDEFDVTCDFHTPTGSKVPLWRCEPAFIRIAESAEYMQMKDNATATGGGLRGLGYLPRRGDDVAFMQREKAAQLQEEMRALALAHPELATAIVALHARRLQLAEMEGTSP